MLNRIEVQSTNIDKNATTQKVVEGINYCFSRHVDTQSLKVGYNLLKSMKVPEADINTLMLLLAAICAKHYKYGYMAAHNSK